MLVRPAERSDLTQLCVTAIRAFAHDPVMRWLYPDDDEYFAPGGEVLRSAMLDWIEYNEVWCTDDGAAVAVWLQPGRPGAPEGESSAEPVSAELRERFSIIGPLLTAHTPDEEHWYLQLIATHPDWQRSGLASALMDVIFGRADSEGLTCHLETETITNVGYYRRHGFVVSGEFDIPTGSHEHRFSSFDADPSTEVGPHMWAMRRPPR